MSELLPLYVISNGDLAKEALNAVVTLLGVSTFATAIRISILFSIIGVAVSYIRGRDIAILAKWFVTYFAITTIMLGPKVTLQIIDSSDPGRADLTVANVPYGLGYPASLITSMAHGLVVAFEEVFTMPDDLMYSKTGVLFGSKLFRLSSEFRVMNTETSALLNEYVKNCVIGDILIPKKYSMAELTESTDLLGTITKDPSNIRGVYVAGAFKTCLKAAGDIKKYLENDLNENGFKKFGKRLFGKTDANSAAELLKSSLQSVYNDYFSYGGLSYSALSIATQNLLINGVRDGILNYTAETGATAALLNLSTTQAMERMRMSLATSRNIAIYTVPIIHTVLLLLMLSLFPIIVLLAFQPSFSAQVLKNYVYTLLWIESWPLMFACLNLIVTFYTKARMGAIGPTGLTISNIDQLALEHSDIANMAGYLMLSIPFISGGLVKGMSSAFNTAANYIGGVLQSSASSAASETATGNVHLGNSSWNNVNANKFDTNSTLMHGMATEQLGTGVLRTSRPDGEPIYDSSHALSKLPVNVRGSEMLSASISEQAEAARTATIQDQRSFDQSTSHAVTELDSLGKSLGSSKSTGESFSSREAQSASQSSSNMHNLATTVANRNHVDVNEVFKGLVNFSQNASASIDGKIPKVNILGAGVGVKFTASTEHLRAHESSTQHGIGRSIDITAEEANRFSNDLHKVEEYSKTAHAETSKSEAVSHLSQLSTDLRNSRASSEQYSAHKAESERLSNAASYVRQNSGQIDADFNQEFAEHLVKTRGREKAEQLFAGRNQAELISYAKEFVGNSGIKSNIISAYQQGSAGINPDQKYQSGYASVGNKASAINAGHAENKQKILTDAKAQGVGVDKQQFDQITNKVENKHSEFNNKLKRAEEGKNGEYNEMKTRVGKNIIDGEEKSKSSALNIKDSIKPGFLDPDKNKKEK